MQKRAGSAGSRNVHLDRKTLFGFRPVGLDVWSSLPVAGHDDILYQLFLRRVFLETPTARAVVATDVMLHYYCTNNNIVETDGYARSRRRVTSTSAFSFVWRYYFRVFPPRSARSTSPSYNGVSSLSRRYLTRQRGCGPTRRLFNFTAAQLLLPGN